MFEEPRIIPNKYSKLELEEIREILNEMYWSNLLSQKCCDAINDAMCFINQNMPKE
jgi:hypothetical protein